MVLTRNFKGGVLMLEGDAHLKNGESVRQRIAWKLQGKGARKTAVVSRDGGKPWTSAFDVLFLKRNGKQE